MRAKKTKRIYVGLREPNQTLATDKQMNFIQGLLERTNKVISDFNPKVDGKRMSLKDASNMIDCLIKRIPFIIHDREMALRNKERKQRNGERSKEAKLQAKLIEREKIAKIKNMSVKKIEWSTNKPKTFDPTPRLTLEQQQARLIQLET